MTPEEKQLYHQIHPLKLLTDIGAEIVSLYLFRRHKLWAGLILGIVPSVIVSVIMLKWADLETYKHSAPGRYIRANMTPFAVMLRILGTTVSHIGAWYQPWLIPLGEGIVMLGWTTGLLQRCAFSLPGNRGGELERCLNLTLNWRSAIAALPATNLMLLLLQDEGSDER